MNNLFQKYWRSFRQKHWAREWDALPQKTKYASKDGTEVREKARMLISQGLKATDKRMMHALSQGWILALSECYKQREKDQLPIWPRNKQGQTLLHMMAMVKDEYLDRFSKDSHLIRVNWTQFILERAVYPKQSFWGKLTTHQKVLWNQADHQGVTPLMLGFYHGIQLGLHTGIPDFKENWFLKDNQGQNVWHHWSKGLVEAQKEAYKKGELSSNWTSEIGKLASPWISILKSCQLRFLNFNFQTSTQDEAWESVDNHNNHPYTCLFKELSKKDFLNLFFHAYEINNVRVIKDFTPPFSDKCLKDNIEILIEKGYLDLLEDHSIFGPVKTESWTKPLFNSNSLLQRILSSSKAS